tara:strand:- start:111 stop:446 length:336 start_codon:yes stop_codon:yes gene_type:complete
MYQYNAVCERVIDGDTIDARIDLGFNVWTFVRIRLYEIDAPEARTRDLEEKARGLRSKEYLKTTLDSSGGKFILKSHGVGKYGRCLGTIYIHGENINQRMIVEGYAKEYDK